MTFLLQCLRGSKVKPLTHEIFYRKSHLTLSKCLFVENLTCDSRRFCQLVFSNWTAAQLKALHTALECFIARLFLVLPLLSCVRVRVWGAGEVPCLIRWFVSLRIWHAVMRALVVYLSVQCLNTVYSCSHRGHREHTSTPGELIN